VSVPAGVRWVGAVLGAAGIPFAYWVFRTIGRNVSETVLTKATHELVTDGPYRWVRHPLYTVGSSLFVAASLLAANWFIGAFTVAVIVMILLVVIPKEEANLIDTFGEAYRAYRKRTGRLLPRLRVSAS
jgi:protein-S-isoprenylcysteine O-methyltransferase Ste14